MEIVGLTMLVLQLLLPQGIQSKKGPAAAPITFTATPVFAHKELVSFELTLSNNDRKKHNMLVPLSGVGVMAIVSGLTYKPYFLIGDGPAGDHTRSLSPHASISCTYPLSEVRRIYVLDAGRTFTLRFRYSEKGAAAIQRKHGWSQITDKDFEAESQPFVIRVMPDGSLELRQDTK